LENDNVILITEEGKQVEIDKLKLKNFLPKLLENLLTKQEESAFSLKIGEEILRTVQSINIKASNLDKKDLELVITDIKTGIPTPKIGFSIKSQLGSPSTLVNASTATNFKFEILDKNGSIPSTIPNLHPKNIKDNIQKLLDMGYQLNFTSIDSDIFLYNLLLIDSNLPETLSKILVSYYSREASTIKDLLNINYDEKKLEGKLAKHKLKEFLSIMALGMVPNTKWDGMLTSLGGLLLVKKEGDVLCYYLYNLEDFQNYLIQNTKLETPSTSRYGIGKIIYEDGRYFIKLNLQIRFLK